jgi:hypothetical protein
MPERDVPADEQVEDLDVPESESELVTGGDGKTKTPAPSKQQQTYYEVKLTDIQVSGIQ